MEIHKDKIVLSSGKAISVDSGIIGISSEFELTEGYGGYLPVDDDIYGEYALTVEEKKEIADHMIARWQTFKATL